MTDRELRHFLSLRPKRLLRWELNSESRAVLFKPRFGRHALARRLERVLGLGEYRIRLDRRGTAVWKSLDGSTPLSATLEIVEEELGREEGQAVDRLKRFIDQMLGSHMIEV